MFFLSYTKTGFLIIRQNASLVIFHKPVNNDVCFYTLITLNFLTDLKSFFKVCVLPQGDSDILYIVY